VAGVATADSRPANQSDIAALRVELKRWTLATMVVLTLLYTAFTAALELAWP
jgi:hypothetical protein